MAPHSHRCQDNFSFTIAGFSPLVFHEIQRKHSVNIYFSNLWVDMQMNKDWVKINGLYGVLKIRTSESPRYNSLQSYQQRLPEITVTKLNHSRKCFLPAIFLQMQFMCFHAFRKDEIFLEEYFYFMRFKVWGFQAD